MSSVKRSVERGAETQQLILSTDLTFTKTAQTSSNKVQMKVALALLVLILLFIGVLGFLMFGYIFVFVTIRTGSTELWIRNLALILASVAIAGSGICLLCLFRRR